MSDEELLLAREVVIRYHAHGFKTKVEEDAVFVWGEGGWEGPLNVLTLQAKQAAEIARIEGDARVAAVDALAREVDRLRRDATMVQYFQWRKSQLEQSLLHAGWVQWILKRAGWDEARAELYAGVAACLHERGELFRESLD